MNVVLSIVLALLLIAALVLAEIKRAVDLRTYWEREERKDGGQ
jgi:hypothetical protein